MTLCEATKEVVYIKTIPGEMGEEERSDGIRNWIMTIKPNFVISECNFARLQEMDVKYITILLENVQNEITSIPVT